MKITAPAKVLSHLEIGRPRTVHNLTLVPLSGTRASSLDYILSDDALAAQKLFIEEVSESGSIQELRVANFSNRFVLVVDGTELVGGKTNRIVNASCLIPPESLTTMPVSGVERKRWHYERREFRHSGQFSPHSIRRENAAFHMVTLREKRGYVSEQGKVWEQVDDLSWQLGIETETGSMNEVMERRQPFLDAYKSCRTLPGAESGAAYFVNGIFQGIELFDSNATFWKMCPKFLSGIAADTMAGWGERLFSPRAKSPEEAREYLGQILEEARNSTFETYDPVGVGEDWRFEAKRSFGKALHYGADLIHFSAFGT